MSQFIHIYGASLNNLKNIDVKIPKNSFTVITGVSGSGKSTLAFDLLYDAGMRKYTALNDMQLFFDAHSGYEKITGLTPTIGIEQRITRQFNPRSTVGSRSRIGGLLASLFALYGVTDPQYQLDEPLTADMFQKNSPRGMCVKCLGKGQVIQFDEAKVFSPPDMPIGSVMNSVLIRSPLRTLFDSFCSAFHLHRDQPLCELNPEALHTFKFGGRTSKFPGVIPLLLNIEKSEYISQRQAELIIDKYGSVNRCPLCQGTGISMPAAHTTFHDQTYSDLMDMPLKQLDSFLGGIACQDQPILGKMIDEIRKNIQFSMNLGLGHLALSRPMPTLSGGEIQRLLLAAYVMSDMEAVTFVFDEPTIGLHAMEKAKLISILLELVQKGNTVIVVEHDSQVMNTADYIIEIGPGAGVNGGRLIFQGNYGDYLHHPTSTIAAYLDSRRHLPERPKRTISEQRMITLHNVHTNNLRNLTIRLPLGVLVGVAGASGSGKSSLIVDTLVPLLVSRSTHNPPDDVAVELADVTIEGCEEIHECIFVDQRPIGRIRTSTIASYIGVMDIIRDLFSNTKEAVEKGYDAGMFSVNAAGGCSYCKGDGVIHYRIGYGGELHADCEACEGSGYVRESLSITLHGKNIREILDMTVVEALEFFSSHDKLQRILTTLDRVGMGYICLGQRTTTLSGGEAQRIKLAKELGAKSGRHHLYILDEPTTGLSYEDIEKLLLLLHMLCDQDNSVIITEHDCDVLKSCDYLIELGPGGGNEGGNIIACGKTEHVLNDPQSILAKYCN